MQTEAFQPFFPGSGSASASHERNIPFAATTTVSPAITDIAGKLPLLSNTFNWVLASEGDCFFPAEA
jgi:hypothetical protein